MRYTIEREIIRDYQYYERQSKDRYNRRCIDGHVTGVGNCVGYCQYVGHQGFLTEKQRKEHNCINKSCNYYLPKPKRERTFKKSADNNSIIIKLVSEAISDLEGIKIMSAERRNDGVWGIKYVTITNDYSISTIEEKLSYILGETVTLINLKYDYDIVAKLIFS